MSAGTLVITFNADGTFSTDARKLEGTDAEILENLQDLAREAGGELVVERHVGHAHTHSHSHVHAGHGHKHGVK